MKKIEKVVIVGGGTAGWMAAAVLARTMGQQLKIELVESEKIGTVGVGEATIPQIRLLLSLLGIDENEFLSQTQGTIKLGIQFNDWSRLGDSYLHAFGDVGRSLGMLEFYQYWLRANRNGEVNGLWEHSLNATAAISNNYERMDGFGETGLSPLIPAYHFDATMVAQFLRRYSENLGVRRTEGLVVDSLIRTTDGFVESLILDGGRLVAGELFIDCSGFRGLLIEELLATGYEDSNQWLPCDRAVAVQTESVDPLLPYTQSTAQEAGWQWRIPLQHRTGNGHVYSSDYLSDDEATATLLKNLDARPLAEPRVLKFQTGMRKKFWNRNVVALGLASGFLEPLESTSIHLVQSGLSRLINLFPDCDFAPEITAEYNRQSATEFECVRDFIILHYYANQRTDSQFWIDRREMPVPDRLTQKIELFRNGARLVEDKDDLFKNVAWVQVLLGQHVTPAGYHPLVDNISEQQLQKFLGDIRQVISHRNNTLSDHRQYLNQHCFAAAAG